MRHQISIEDIGKPHVARRQGCDGVAELRDPRPRPASFRDFVEAIAQRALGAGTFLIALGPSDSPFSRCLPFPSKTHDDAPTRSSSSGLAYRTDILAFVPLR